MHTILINVAITTSLFASMALPIFAETSTTPPTPPPTINQKSTKSVNLACIQAAVEKRDNTIITAVDTYSASVKLALQTRRDSLKTAWGITDRAGRRAALRDAWKQYQMTLRKAVKDLHNNKHTAWKDFYADRKACGNRGASDDPGTEGSDMQL